MHIVSFDVPYPADYGGAIDVFYRIKALYELGVEITLHCFEYGRGKQAELDQYCKAVIYYPRKKKVTDQLSRVPFIVLSRKNDRLIQSLLKDDAPILFEGLHTTYYLSDPRLKSRIKIVRTHNIEHEYYDQLSKSTRGIQRQYLRTEAKKLKRYEEVLRNADHILCIKESDKQHFAHYNRHVSILPACSIETNFNYQETQARCLFHGNLSVAENETGARWIMKCLEGLPLTIAGKSPSPELLKTAENNGVQVIADPSDEALNTLIQTSGVHVFYTEQATGVKLKLLNALRSSGVIIVNEKMIEGTDLVKLCLVANTKDAFRKLVEDKLDQSLSNSEFEQRREFLEKYYSNKTNCEVLLQLISGE